MKYFSGTKIKKFAALFMAVVFFTTSFGWVFPLMADASSGNGIFIDGARIQITKFEITDDADLSPDARQIGRDKVNALIREQILNKDFKRPDISSNNSKYRFKSCGEHESVLDASNSEGVSNGEMYTPKDEPLWLKNNDPAFSFGEDNCFAVSFPGTRSFEVKVNPNNNDLWFYAKSSDTLVRADGDGGDYKQDPNDRRRFNRVSAEGDKCGAGQPYVILSQDTVGDRTRALYESCDDWEMHDIYVTKNAPVTPTTGTEDPAETATPTCESRNPQIIIGWLVCSFINLLDEAVDSTTNLVNDMLEVDSEDLSDEAGLHQVWSLFRAVSSFALIAVAMAMIIGQALGGDH